MKDIKRLSEILGFKVPLDGLMMAVLGKPCIDIVALDGKLLSRYRYKGSMDEFILNEFGSEAHEIFSKTINEL